MSSNVSLEIGGRRYTIACAPGEEDHIRTLGAAIDDRLAKLDHLKGQSAERTMLFASLLLADELHEAKGPSEGKGIVSAPVSERSPDEDHAELLENLADRLESLATQLENAASDT